MLALRPDLVSPELRDELLLELVDPAPSLPWRAASKLLAAEFPSLDSVFRSIDPVPLFSNGLSQAHAAVTADGQSVLVKFLLPGVRDRARRDARRALAFARLMPSERTLIAQLTLLVDRDLDLVQERENLSKLAVACDNNPLIRIPRIFPELSTPRVLTRENLGGAPLTEVLSPARRPFFKIEGQEVDARAVAARLIEGATRQILAQRFYCADVSPANVLVLPGNTFTFAGFNHCEAVDPENSLTYTHFLNDVFTTELPRMARSFEELLIATDSSRGESLREDFVRESHEWLRSAPPAYRIRSAADFSSPLSNWLVAVLRVARRNRFEIPHEVLAVFRTLIGVETIAIRLDPAVHLQSTGQEIFKDIVLDNVFDRIEPAKIRAALVNTLTALNNAPEYLNRFLIDSAQGRLGLGLSATEHPHFAASRDRRHKLLAASIAAVGVAWLMGEPGLPSVGTIPGTRLLGAILAALYLYIVVLWRRLG
jgi:ubiquinone biosynthesis protein